MASFFIPLTGLESDSTALNTIANDLSNMNSTAFKAQSTNFSDLFYQQIASTGSGNPIEVGAGMKVASNSTDFSQGSYNTTGTSSSDMAIDGNGFFIVNNGGANLYTRDGAFTQDTSGNLVTSGGLSVMGYPAPGGVVNTNAPLTAINVPLMGQVQQPNATSTISMTTNLDSDSSTAFPYTMSVYDSQGESHDLTVTYTQTGTNTWTYSAALPAKDFISGVSTPVTGIMTFDANGNLSTIQETAPIAAATASTVGTANGDASSIALGFTGLTDKATDLDIKWNLLGSAGTPNISQEFEQSAVTGSTANGNAAGTCTGFNIGSDGTVTATYSSGSDVVGRIALANMTNLQGLKLIGDGNYATTLASGTASVGTSGTNGMGMIEDSALEDSNVNISSEFSELIIAQRAFEANAKSITTFDTVTQDTINMVH